MKDQSRDNLELARKIDAYVQGKLSEDEIDALWLELLRQPGYLEYLKTEAALKDLLEERLQDVPVPSAGSRVPAYRTWLSIAATIVLVLASVFVFRWAHQRDLTRLAPDQIAMNELESADVMRSKSSGKIKKIDSLLNLGFESALSGNTQRARKIFTDIVHEYPNAATRAMASFNLGTLQYNANELDSAASSFREASQIAGADSITLQKSRWFLANTYLKTKREKEARALLHQISGSKGLYAGNAAKLLAELNQH